MVPLEPYAITDFVSFHEDWLLMPQLPELSGTAGVIVPASQKVSKKYPKDFCSLLFGYSQSTQLSAVVAQTPLLSSNFHLISA